MNNDETMYSIDAKERSLKQPKSETVVPTDEVSNSNEGHKANIAGLTAAVVGSVAVGGLGAWGLYSYINRHDEDLSNVVEKGAKMATDVKIEGEHLELADNAVANAQHDQMEETPANVPEVEYVQLLESQINSENVIVGIQYDADGHRVMLIDADHDGQFDIRAVDINDDGEFAQLTDLHEEGNEPLLVADFQHNLEENGIEPLYTWNPEGDNSDANNYGESLQLTGVEQITDDDGNTMNVAIVKVGGQDVILLDVDNDGQFDYIASDFNGNGEIDNTEMQELDSPITLAEIQELPHSDDFESYETLAAYDDVDVVDDYAIIEVSDVDAISENDFADADVADADDADVIEISDTEDGSDYHFSDSVDTIDMDNEFNDDINIDGFGTYDDDGINV